MIVNKATKASDKKLDEEFPSLALLPKRAASSIKENPQNCPPSNSNSQNPSSLQSSIGLPSSSLPTTDAYASPEQLLQTELSQQDFCHALTSELNMIPDPPYDSREVDANCSAIDTPPSFPQTKNMKLMQPEFFKKIDLSTLFFIFFFSNGTSQKYFAGRELHNREWYYHTKFQTWVHRVEEPKEKTSEYEIAKYEFFDHATNEGWCVRQKPNFKMEFDSLIK